MTNVRLLYVTTKNIEEARWIGHRLVEQRLVACANILPQMETIYRWNGGIQTDKECVLILKTQESQVDAAQKAILELHSYEVPCVLSLAVEKGSEAYVKWLNEESRPS